MLLIFDFDGVVADSEIIACSIAARYATELGAEISDAEGLALFLGRRSADVRGIITARGGDVPDDFERRLLAKTLDAFAEGLNPVAGVEAFLANHRHIPRCIASSSSHSRLAASLSRIGLSDWFEGRIFSADDVRRGKPWPDLFLYAAAQLGVDPHECVVIEDSPGGVSAAVAAGMRVYGLLAGSHQSAATGNDLRAAGATDVADSFEKLATFLRA